MFAVQIDETTDFIHKITTCLPMSNSSYRADIDGLRAIAVLLVLFFHCGFAFLPGGFVGVDVFFVISGFLITSLLLDEVKSRGTISFAKFYERRLRRLAPALLTTVALTLLAGSFILAPTDLTNVAESVVYSLSGISNIYFYYGDDYWSSDQIRPLLHTWSLSVEEQFYLVWPALVVFIFGRLGLTNLSFILIAIILASFFANIFFPINDVALYYLTHFRLFEMGGGGLLAIYFKSKKAIRLSSPAWSAVGLLLIGYSALTLNKDSVFPSYNAIAPTLGTILIIFSRSDALFNRVLSCQIFVWVGLRSYSLYLIHWPLIVYAQYIIADELEFYGKILVACTSILLAHLMFKYVEQPFRGAGRLLPTWSPAALATPAFAIAFLIIITSSTIMVGNGWSWRLGDQRLEMIANFQDNDKNAYDAFSGVEQGSSQCRGPVCTFPSKEKAKNFVLIGRSHARHFVNGLLNEGESFTFYHVDCNSFFGPYCDNGRFATTQYLDQRDKVLELVRGNFPLIIISEVLRYSNGKGIKEAATGKTIKFKTETEWLIFIENSLISLKKKFPHQKILLIGETPRRGRMMNSLNCITRPFMPEDCFSTPIEVHEKWLNINKKLSTMARRVGINFFNPHEYLCDDSSCKNFIGGQPIYADYHHYSDEGSKYMAEHLERHIKYLRSL
ncbi:acyltransferase family protein [Microbulbifer sp. TYP-18]|uniref:acyltransferase family protein n=1 Tax=Microbulbifer sp. TYP-18 TaxID=3230024 RepID=UPI0034C5EE8A